MRLCRSCRAPIDNHIKSCPSCGSEQVVGLTLNTESEPTTQRGFLSTVLSGLVDLFEVFPALIAVVLGLPLVLAACAGHFVAGMTGAVVATIIASILILAVWSQRRG